MDCEAAVHEISERNNAITTTLTPSAFPSRVPDGVGRASRNAAHPNPPARTQPTNITAIRQFESASRCDQRQRRNIEQTLEHDDEEQTTDAAPDSRRASAAQGFSDVCRCDDSD
jgi:hypothetical protein